jgi:hypothetical protein
MKDEFAYFLHHRGQVHHNLILPESDNSQPNADHEESPKKSVGDKAFSRLDLFISQSPP